MADRSPDYDRIWHWLHPQLLDPGRFRYHLDDLLRMFGEARIEEQDRIIEAVRQHAWALRQSGDSKRAEEFEDVADYIDRIGRTVLPVVVEPDPVEVSAEIQKAVDAEIEQMVDWVETYAKDRNPRSDHPLWRDACLTEHEAEGLAEVLKKKPWRKS